MKHLEVCQKYSTVCHIFYSLRGVSSGDETLRSMLDILHQGTNPSYLYTNYTFPGEVLLRLTIFTNALIVRMQTIKQAAKWQTGHCKTRHFAGQTGNVQAENALATLILVGWRSVKQLSLGSEDNEILRIPF